MAKFRKIQNSLIAGEISPTAQARTDLPQLQHGCRLLRNMIPLLSGGAYRRPGTFYETKYAYATNYAPNLIPFVVSRDEAYCLVLGKTVGSTGFVDYIRPSGNTAPSSSGSATGSHGYLAATSTNANGSYDEMLGVQHVQSADVLYLVHPNRKPYRVRRTAANTFKIAEFDTDSTGTTLTGTAFRDAWPYRPKNTDGNIRLGVNTKTVGTGRTLTSIGAFFVAGHVGAVFKIDDGAGVYGCVKVTAVTNSTTATCDVIVECGDVANHTTWWESSWSDYRGWPRSVAFFKNRIVYGGNLQEPDSMWFSQPFNYDVMSVVALLQATSPGDGSATGPSALQPFQITLASLQTNAIQWLVGSDSLFVGTKSDEWIIDTEYDATTTGFSAANSRAKLKTAYGSDYIQARRIGNEVAMACASQADIRALIFNNDQQTYVAEPVQLLYDEFPKSELLSNSARKIRKMAWDESRKTLWCVDTAGNLVGMTRERQLQVTAWHSHRLGGYDSTELSTNLGSGGTATLDPAYYSCSGSVVSLAVVPNPILGYNDLWLVVKRKINGSFQYHIERMIGGPYPNEECVGSTFVGAGNYYVDAAAYRGNDYPLTETFTPATVTHLEGKALKGTAFVSKGLFTLTGSTVTAGATTISSWPSTYDNEAGAHSLGLQFDAIVAPLRTEAGSVIGTAQGAIKRIHEVSVRFWRTLAAKLGRDADNEETLIFRDGSTPLNESPELFTGDKIVKPDSDYDREGYIYIHSDAALPFAVMGFIAEGTTADG